MKICVFSDSHGNPDNMIKAVETEQPEMCFFLGDGERDLAVFSSHYPDLPVYSVRGNCDFRSKASIAIVCNIGGISFFATHGHMDNVKYEPALDTLTAHALDAGADIALFGHTHVQHISSNRGVTLINPGTIGRSIRPCYAVIEIDSGKFTASARTLKL